MSDSPETVAVEAFLRRVDAEVEAVAALAGMELDAILDSLLVINACGGKVATTGVGASGIVARRLAHFLSLIGVPSFYYDVLDAAHGSLASVGVGDLLVAFSKSGATNELNCVVEALRDRGVSVVAVLCEAGPLVEIASKHVLLPLTSLGDPEGVLVAGSTLMMSAWCDSVVDGLLHLRRLTWREVARNHPSGAIGRRFLEDPD